MRRGILILNREELVELGKVVANGKIKLALMSLEEENRILVNDEELEDILDYIGKPESNEILLSVFRKISELLLSLRS